MEEKIQKSEALAEFARIKSLPSSPSFKILERKPLDRDGVDIGFKLELPIPYDRLYSSDWFSGDFLDLFSTDCCGCSGKLPPASIEKAVLEDYEDWYKRKYGGVVMVNNYWINEFISGR